MVGTERGGGGAATAPLERRDEVAACDRETMKRVRGRTGGRDPVATGKGGRGRRGRAGEKSVSFSFFRLSLPLLRHLFFFLLRRLYSQQLGISRATLDIVFAASRVSFSLEILSARRRACIPILRLSSFFPFLSGRASAAGIARAPRSSTSPTRNRESRDHETPTPWPCSRFAVSTSCLLSDYLFVYVFHGRRLFGVPSTWDEVDRK